MTPPVNYMYAFSNETHSDINILPPMIFSNFILGIVALTAWCVINSNPITVIRTAVRVRRAHQSAARRATYIANTVCNMVPFFRPTVTPEPISTDGCRFVRAFALDKDGAGITLDRFSDVLRNARNRRTITLCYTVGADNHEREYIATYGPSAPTGTTILCPPHNSDWKRNEEDSVGILTASLTVAHVDERVGTYDVSDMLRKRHGPLGDFHGRAGVVLTARDLIPELDDDVVQANVIYYDNNGTEHTFVIPTGVVE